MPNVSVYNQAGQTIGEVSLSDAIFNVKPEAGLLHEVVTAERANARRAIANTKTRGEVSGGGKKPWKQKGTGRARQGSIRSPQWVGGGITFGPSKERNFSVKVNKKTKRKALFMALTDKVLSKQFVVIDEIALKDPKTSRMASLLRNLPVGKTSLIVAAGSQPEMLRMTRNLPNAKLVSAESVSLFDVIAHRTVVFLKDAVPVFEKRYL